MSVVPSLRACTEPDASGARTGTLGRRGGRHYMYTTRGNSPCPPPLPYSRGMWLDSHTVDTVVNKHQHISPPTANVMLLRSSMSMKSRWRLTVILSQIVCFVFLLILFHDHLPLPHLIANPTKSFLPGPSKRFYDSSCPILVELPSL